MRTAIQVYCKAPVPGTVKTRLIPQLGVDDATSLHEQLALESIQDAIKAAKNLQDCEVQVWCTPDIHHEFFQQLPSRVTLHEQLGDDLGERMFNGASTALNAGAAGIIVIGTDCPPVDAMYLRNAVERLEGMDAVIAPAEDGGYGLIGLSRVQPELFTDISWGTEQVYEQTVRILDALNWRWQKLDEIWDVDRAEDVARYRKYHQPAPTTDR